MLLRERLQALEQEMRDRDTDLPVYWAERLAEILAAPEVQPVDTYTPLLWVTLNDDEKYAEYIRVRQIAARVAVPEPKP